MELVCFVEEEGRLGEVAASLFPHITIGSLRAAIDSGALTVNGGRASRMTFVSVGDCVEFDDIDTPGVEAVAVDIEALFEDESLIIVNKPAGVPVVPVRNSTEWRFMGMLLHHAESCGLCRAGGRRFRIVHRLDSDTSGALVVAKSLEAARSMSLAFSSGQVRKTYLALVKGRPKGEGGEIAEPIGKGRGGRVRAVSEGGKESFTRWRVVENFRGYALLEVEIKTGRTHQIRVHLEYDGLPLAVDDMYGGAGALMLSDFKKGYRCTGREKPLMERLSLHCLRLEFAHPVTCEKIAVEAPLPGDFARALKALGKYAAA